MSVDINSEDVQYIRNLVPFVTMPNVTFSAICAEMSVEEIQSGCIFSRGDADARLVYLLSGEVTLQAEGLIVETIAANTEAARFALAHQIPRKIDAVANGAVRFFRLDADIVNNAPPIEYKEDTSVMIVEESEDDAGDWMTALLKHPVFQRLPPANLQKILMGLEQVEYKEGTNIIEQGAPGDYYYLLKTGQCLVTRRPFPNAKEIKLGLLEKGETFGEDSLITGLPRSVSITAMTSVCLLRLEKKQFVSLIKEPSLKFIEYDELEGAVKKGASLLDLRSPDEYEKGHLGGSINLPYFSLRMHFKSLSRDKASIMICSDGRASEAAAFLLLKNKFNALILKGGMNAIPLESDSQSFAQYTIDDGVETLIEFRNADRIENPREAVDDHNSNAANAHLEDQIKFLKLENEALRKSVHQLNDKCLKLGVEKENIDKQFGLLSQQLEKMKKELNGRKGN